MKRSSSLRSLCPEVLDDLLVVGGRLRHACIGLQARFPVILPKNHPLTRKILSEYHDAAHLGTEWTLSIVRQKFWVPGARNVLRGLRRKCVVCQRLYGKPMVQQMADLPPVRCTVAPAAFSHVGTDLFGPFLSKVGRAHAKRYICVYVCMSVRAVHFEVLESLSTDSFINGFVRFSSRRGYPKSVRSDNGTGLVGARSELASALKELDRNKIIQAARRHEVQWTFTPPHNSQAAGSWERQIRTARKVLSALLSRTPVALTDEILTTLFCEVECIMNSRPITKCGSSIHDAMPLTPNHFLMAKGNFPLAWTPVHRADAFKKRWRQVQLLADTFWKRWLREYLPELQRRARWDQVHRDLVNWCLWSMSYRLEDVGHWG